MAQEEQDRERSSETISGVFRDVFLCPTDKQLENATITHSQTADRIMVFRDRFHFHSGVSPIVANISCTLTLLNSLPHNPWDTFWYRLFTLYLSEAWTPNPSQRACSELKRTSFRHQFGEDEPDIFRLATVPTCSPGTCRCLATENVNSRLRLPGEQHGYQFTPENILTLFLENNYNLVLLATSKTS